MGAKRWTSRKKSRLSQCRHEYEPRKVLSRNWNLNWDTFFTSSSLPPSSPNLSNSSSSSFPFTILYYSSFGNRQITGNVLCGASFRTTRRLLSTTPTLVAVHHLNFVCWLLLPVSSCYAVVGSRSDVWQYGTGQDRTTLIGKWGQFTHPNCVHWGWSIDNTFLLPTQQVNRIGQIPKLVYSVRLKSKFHVYFTLS